MPRMYAYGDRIKKIYAFGNKIKKIYYKDERVWTGASEVTYIVNGTTYVEEIDEGENILAPSHFSFNVPDATFIGFTTREGSTEPMTEVLATGEPMTVYVIWKTNDRTLQSGTFYSVDCQGWAERLTATVFTGIDAFLYSAVGFHYTCNLQCTFRGSHLNITSSCGGKTLTFGYTGVNWYATEDDRVETPLRCNANYRIDLTQTSGNTNLTCGCNGSGGVVNGQYTYSNLIGYGRTHCG